MLKIKWNMIPPEFKYGYMDWIGSVWVSERKPDNCSVEDKGTWNYDYSTEFENVSPRRLADSEYEVDPELEWKKSLCSREEWEREQWKSAPEWATYHATDEHESSNWFSHEPLLVEADPKNTDTGGGFALQTGYVRRSCVTFQYGEDWKQSLRKRPESVNAKKIASDWIEKGMRRTTEMANSIFQKEQNIEKIIRDQKEFLDKNLNEPSKEEILEAIKYPVAAEKECLEEKVVKCPHCGRDHYRTYPDQLPCNKNEHMIEMCEQCEKDFRINYDPSWGPTIRSEEEAIQYRQDVLHVAAIFKAHLDWSIEDVTNRAIKFIEEVDKVLAEKEKEK